MRFSGISKSASKIFFDVTSIDNWTFKMYYETTVLLAIFCSAMLSVEHFFGKPITCDAGIVS